MCRKAIILMTAAGLGSFIGRGPLPSFRTLPNQRDPNAYWDDGNDVYWLNGRLEVSDVNLTSATAERLVATDVNGWLESSDAANWIAGTANQVTVSDDADGTVTLSLPQDIDTSADPNFSGIELSAFASWSATAGITAVNPGVQGDGPLVTMINEVSTVANGNDAVTLPAARAGRTVVIVNNGANILEIWPASGDDAGAGADTAVTLAAGSNVRYVAYDAANWEAVP